MDAYTYFLIVHNQNKIWNFLECILLNNNMIFIKETILRIIVSTIVYLKLNTIIRLFFKILDYEIIFQDFILFYMLLFFVKLVI